MQNCNLNTMKMFIYMNMKLKLNIKIDEMRDKTIEKMNKIIAMLRGVKMQVNL